MSPEERKQLWQERINAYKESNEPTIKSWCHHNQIGVQSMYKWIKRLASESSIPTQPATQWVALSQSDSHSISNASLRIHISNMSIEIQNGFNRALLKEVLEILQDHVK
jgi:hypothetical protein